MLRKYLNKLAVQFGDPTLRPCSLPVPRDSLSKPAHRSLQLVRNGRGSSKLAGIVFHRASWGAVERTPTLRGELSTSSNNRDGEML